MIPYRYILVIAGCIALIGFAIGYFVGRGMGGIG